MKHLHNYLLFPTLSFKHILKIPLPMNALKISACQIFLPLQKYVNAITGIFRLMICYGRNEEGNKFFTYTCTLKT